MIPEALQFLSDPFLARRDESEDLFDHRFKEAAIDCPRCERGWRHYDGIWVRCNDCQDGEIYTLLCSRCGLNENECQCNVEDFMEGR